MSRLSSLKIKAKLLQKAKKNSGSPIPLKEAYEIIAKSAGHPSWRHMKEVLERHSLFRPKGISLPYWNNWYADYKQAKKHLRSSQDYLLPYEEQFFICKSDYIEALGISTNDPDLKLVGNDWYNPKDQEAFSRLLKKIFNHQKEQ